MMVRIDEMLTQVGRIRSPGYTPMFSNTRVTVTYCLPTISSITLAALISVDDTAAKQG